MKNLKKNILKKIKSGEVKKTSKWYFIGREYLLWTFLLSSFVAGGISFAVLLRLITKDYGLGFEWKLNHSILISNIFWIWLGLTILSIVSTVFYYKKTENGFRYRNFSLILITFLGSLVLGLVFYKIHLGQYINKYFYIQNHIHYLDNHHNIKK